MRFKIFISSVQDEFEQIRRDLKAYLLGDALLSRFISTVFLFEDLPAHDRRADQVYLEEVECCDVYLGIFGYTYGNEGEDGVSPTEQEYNHAGLHGKTRLVYIWGQDEKQRAPGMKRLIKRVDKELVRRRVDDYPALTAGVYASLVEYLDKKGSLRIPPFDTSACRGATLKHLSRRRMDWFLETAGRVRGFPLKLHTTPAALLTHLNLLDGEHPVNAAILLFGMQPQHFHRAAETKCVHCHGTEYQRPFASQQIYTGDLFEQVDQARDFVLAKINRPVGVRNAGPAAPAAYELPPDAVAEAIVNAIVHRDYHSHASVEVRLFADRLEVWNPGALPRSLTLDSLRTDHPSVPRNPLLAESFYLVRYSEKAGSGTQAMIGLCRDAGLPEPNFELRQGSFVITLWRDWLTEDVLAGLDLNERQKLALKLVRTQERMTNSQYQESFSVAKRTATMDLNELVVKGLLEKVGTTGKGVYYRMSKGVPKGQ